jgi:hypothetical protein
MSIKVRCRPHLVKFLEHLYGKQPIVFPRKDNFNKILNMMLGDNPEQSKTYNRTDVNLDIQLPYFENKNVLYNFELSSVQETKFIQKIEDLFTIVFRDEMDQWRLMGIKGIDALQLFMERYGISQDSIDMLIKDYYRYRKRRNAKDFHNRKKNSSVKSRFCPASNHI